MCWNVELLGNTYKRQQLQRFRSDAENEFYCVEKQTDLDLFYTISTTLPAYHIDCTSAQRNTEFVKIQKAWVTHTNRHVTPLQRLFMDLWISKNKVWALFQTAVQVDSSSTTFSTLVTLHNLLRPLITTTHTQEKNILSAQTNKQTKERVTLNLSLCVCVDNPVETFVTESGEREMPVAQ